MAFGIEYILRLNSNQQRSKFPENCSVDFQTEIDKRHTFNSNYEVAVKEFAFPIGTYNVLKDLTINWESSLDGKNWIHRTNIRFPAGFYYNIDSVVHELNVSIQEASEFQNHHSNYMTGKIPRFFLDDEKRVLTCEAGYSWNKSGSVCGPENKAIDCLTLPLRLEQMLGFENPSREFLFYEGQMTSTKSDLSYPFQKLYLKTNFTAHILLELSAFQLLHGTDFITIKEPVYIPILDEIDVAHLSLYTEEGKRVRSDSYKGLVTLSFRYLGTKTDYKEPPLKDVINEIE